MPLPRGVSRLEGNNRLEGSLGIDIGETNNLLDQATDRGGALRDVLEWLDGEMVDRAF